MAWSTPFVYLLYFVPLVSVALRSETDVKQLEADGSRGCEEEDLQEAVKILRLPSVQSTFTADDLADALQISEEEVHGLLSLLGFTSALSLPSFCRAALDQSPKLLHERIPRRDVGCLDQGCGETVNISIDELLKVPLVPPPESADLVPLEISAKQIKEPQAPRDVLREVLQRFFDVYPSAPVFDASTSLMQRGQLGPDPQFQAGGFLIRDQVEKEFIRCTLLATRWVVEAMEILKLEYNNDKVNQLFKGWFKSSADDVKQAVSQHLYNIYMVLIYMHVIKAPSSDRPCSTQGNMAYVKNGCPSQQLPHLQSNPCGERSNQLYVVHICPITWASPSMFHVGNIIHEASHHYGTKDLAYGMKPCLDLNTAQAVSNADQYVYFIQHIMAVKYPSKMMRSYRGMGKGDHEFDQQIFARVK